MKKNLSSKAKLLPTVLFFLIANYLGAQTAYITSNGDDNVYVIDVTTNELEDIIDVGNGPWGVVVSPDGTKVYVVNNDEASLSVINRITNTVVETIDIGDSPTGVTVSPDGVNVYATNYDEGL